MHMAATEQYDDFQALTLAFQDALGVIITDQQRSSLLVKLERVMHSRGLKSIVQLAEKMRKADECPLNSDVLQAITSAESSWFQFPEISRLLRQYVLDNIAGNATARDCRMWVVGCGDGSLAYSIAMDVAEHNRLKGNARQVSIIATDVSADAVKHAESACYRTSQMHGLGDELRASYMRRHDEVSAPDSPVGESWEISPKIRQQLSFKQCDVLDDISHIGLVDVIICPDILVYFSNARRTELLEKFSNQLTPGGVFLTAEGQPVLSNALERVEHPEGVFYRQKY